MTTRKLPEPERYEHIIRADQLNVGDKIDFIFGGHINERGVTILWILDEKRPQTYFVTDRLRTYTFNGIECYQPVILIAMSTHNGWQNQFEGLSLFRRIEEEKEE